MESQKTKKKSFFRKGEMPDFFKMLSEQCRITLEGIEQLILFMDNQTQETAAVIEKYEKEADQVRRSLIEDVEMVFIAPLDRHDMFALSRSLDDIMDKINDLKDLIIIFELQPESNVKEIAILCKDAIWCLGEAIHNWKTDDQEHFWCHLIRAKKTENQIKRKYWESVIEIGQTGLPIDQVLKMREMSKDMNSLGNKIGKAADRIGDIKMKMIN